MHSNSITHASEQVIYFTGMERLLAFYNAIKKEYTLDNSKHGNVGKQDIYILSSSKTRLHSCFVCCRVMSHHVGIKVNNSGSAWQPYS